jgi:glycosyltransferase involved in cell wall biosynthesis
MDVPQVSVVIPARNASATLKMTMESLRAQSFQDFDVVVVDDGSTDGTGELAASYGRYLDVQVLCHESSQGVARALNAGIAASRAPLIARLDADDLARQDRLAVQTAFMASHPRIDICGSDMAMFSGGEGTAVQAEMLSHPMAHADIQAGMVQRNTLAHPSLLIRRGFFDEVGGYDDRFESAEDYELWTRGILFGKQYANIREPLTYYRLHAGQVTRSRAQLQREQDLAIKKKYLTGLLDGTPQAHAAEFLSSLCRFASKDMALNAFHASLPAILKLAERLPGKQEYARIVQESVAVHLG